MAYKLYFFPDNASLAPHMLLRELAVPFDLALVDRKEDAQHSPDYLRLNPHGRIPVLVDGDLVLYEAAAIMLHLADRHPDAGWSPPLGSPRRAQLYKWLIYLTNTLQAEMMLWFYPQRFTDDPNGAPAVKAAMGRRIAAIFAHLADELSDRPYLLDETISIADLYLFMLAYWGYGLAPPALELPALRRFAARIAVRPAVRATFAAEGINLPPA